MPQIFKIIFLFYLYGLKFLGPGCHSKIFQRKMCSSWSENFLRNCEKVSNVTLVCKDGKLTSHKIILARISDYIRDLMLLIPNEEDIIIMLPDFPIKMVRDFVTKHIFKGKPLSLFIDKCCWYLLSQTHAHAHLVLYQPFCTF